MSVTVTATERDLLTLAAIVSDEREEPQPKGSPCPCSLTCRA
jgi:hypothetical protein